MCSFEYKAAVAVPPESMRKLEGLPIIEPKVNIITIGISQSSIRMSRIGQAPLLKFGFAFTIAPKDKQAAPSDAPATTATAVKPYVDERGKENKQSVAKPPKRDRSGRPNVMSPEDEKRWQDMRESLGIDGPKGAKESKKELGPVDETIKMLTNSWDVYRKSCEEMYTSATGEDGINKKMVVQASKKLYRISSSLVDSYRRMLVRTYDKYFGGSGSGDSGSKPSK